MPTKDDVDPIPAISAHREAASGTSAVPRRRGASRGGSGSTGGGRSGAGPLLWLLTLVALGVGGGALAWAWNLGEELVQTGYQLERYEARIADLEARLADTDEGMNQNATVQAAKIRELDSEVRKLWDNVWKRSKQRLGVLEASSKRFEQSITGNTQSIEATQSELGRARQDLAALQSIGGDLERVLTSAQSNQTQVERIADALNRAELQLTRVEKRVGEHEEWLRAVDGFRQSTNASINQLQAALRTIPQ